MKKKEIPVKKKIVKIKKIEPKKVPLRKLQVRVIRKPRMLEVIIIKPTVGRVLWFYPYGQTQLDAKEDPYAAIIARVISDTVINIAYFDANGVVHNQTGVHLVQEGEMPPPNQAAFCVWMPYQIGQAKK